MKTQIPLRHLLFAPLVAIAMISGALTPLSVAQADPLDQDADVVVEVTQDPDVEDDATPDSDTVVVTQDPAVEDDATLDTDADVDVTQDTDAEVDVTEDSDPGADLSQDSDPGVNPLQKSATDSDVTQDSASETGAVQDSAADLDAAFDSNAAVPLTADAAAVAASRGLSSMRLRKSNGAWVTITPKMQANALVVINTIRSAKWSGVSSKEKDRLIVIALMTMAQESTFYTHPYAHVPDRNQDVGPFQQRSKVGWYADGATQAENVRILNNIPYATRTFIEGHRVPRYVRGGAGPRGYIIPGVFQIRNWRTDNFWSVAANVQRPARQYRYHYEYWRPVVQSMVKKLAGYSPNNSEPSDVYTTAGDHWVEGRHWRTTCAPYSKSIDRCTAKIWGTQVTRVGNRFVQKNAWYFNNLTYRPSPRAGWAKNPLARTGKFVSDGRQWRTECAVKWTGPNACRSFIYSSVIEPYLDRAGNRQFRDTKKWVFNNIVQFSD